MRDPARCIELARRLCVRFGLQPLQPQVEACLDLMRIPGGTEVALRGPFNAGKRSFLNFLMGKAILPVDALPAAGVATKLRFGFLGRATVHAEGGGRTEIPLDRLAEFITEPGNPGNAKGILSVEVETPAMGPWRGLRFIDGPGPWTARDAGEGLEAGRTLVAFPMDHPLDEGSLDVLAGALGGAGSVLLLTKSDLREGAERERLVEFLQAELRGRMGVKVPVMMFSTHEGFGAIQQEMKAYLAQAAGEGGDPFEEAREAKVRALLGGVEDYLLLADWAAQADEDARLDLRRRIQVQRVRLGTLRREVYLLATQIKTRARAAGERHFRPQGPELTRRLQNLFNREAAGRGMGLKDRPRILRAWFAETLSEELGILSESGRPPFEPFLEAAGTLAAQTVRSFKEQLSKEMRKLTGIPFEGAPFPGLTQSPVTPEIQLLPGSDDHLERLGSKIAADLVQPLLERRFLKQLPREVERNLHRLAGQWTGSIDSSIDGLIEAAMAFMEGELASMEGVVADAPGRRTEIQEALAELRTLRREA